jgi:glycosyltransferase involved in cell wall biosynthesis
MWTWQIFGKQEPIKPRGPGFIECMNTALVIPIYCPNEKVLPFLKNFKANDFGLFVVVDDGSGEQYQPVFDAIRDLGIFTVLSYPSNKGKGHALKEAFRYIYGQHPEIHGIVTADGDGQHTYKDILRVRDALAEHPDELVMGERDFDSPNVPKRSKGGNRFSSFYFKLFSGKKLPDTQSGLRGIPEGLFPLAIDEQGERYEYEMNFIMDATKETTIYQLPIETIYEDGNKVSHFRPFRDTCRIYRTPITYVLVALSSWGIDELAFFLISTFISNELVWRAFYGVVIARIISGLYNFIINMKVVFPSKGGRGQKSLRYAIMFVVNMGLTFGLTYAFASIPSNWALTFIKICVDTVLAIANYFVNWIWVFSKKKHAKKGAVKPEPAKEKGGDIQ